MNKYFIRFLNLELSNHLSMWKHDFNGNVFMTLILCAVVFLLFFALPYAIIKMINEKESNIKNKKWNVVIDITSVIVFLLIGQMLFNFFATMVSGISSVSTVDINQRNLVFHRKFIADICGILYSLLLNTRLFSKYIKNQLVKRVIFVILCVISLFIFYYFYYLCHIIVGW